MLAVALRERVMEFCRDGLPHRINEVAAGIGVEVRSPKALEETQSS